MFDEQAKAVAVKEKAAFDSRLANLRNESRIVAKEVVAAGKRARDPKKAMHR